MLSPIPITTSTLRPTAVSSTTSLRRVTDVTENSNSNSNMPQALSYRLLYRGALSLPDSLLLLDGLTFAANLDSPSKHSVFGLLENPLALALETMRGRPTLRFIGVVELKETYMDESGGVEMDIHPSAVISQIYFQNMFCLLSFPAPSTSTVEQRSEIGIKVALGDSNGPETTHMVIFAQVSSESSKTIRLRVGRITQRPAAPAAQKHGPRPDDPIPRKPPAFFLRTGSFGGVGRVKDLKRVESMNTDAMKKQNLSGDAKPTGNIADLGSGVRLGGAKHLDSGDVFKVPELPKKSAKAKGKEKEQEKDVFDYVYDVVSGKDKQKTLTVEEEAAFEKANKNTVKRATIDYLAKTKDPTDAIFIEKQHPEFKELYNFIYRGVGFALRAKMRTCNVDLRLVMRLIDMHALMYLGGHGGSAEEGGP